MIWNQKEPCFAEQIEILIIRGKKEKSLSINDFKNLFNLNYPIPYNELSSTIKYIKYNISSLMKSIIYCRNQGNCIKIRYNSCEMSIYTDERVSFIVNAFDNMIINKNKDIDGLRFTFNCDNQPFMKLSHYYSKDEYWVSSFSLGFIENFNDIKNEDIRNNFLNIQLKLKDFLSVILYEIYLSEVNNDD